MKLEINGRKSARDKSRHIDIRYYFITDVITREGLKVKYCKTEKMLADFFTKPLQGGLFKYLRSMVMGHALLPSEERVDKNGRNEKFENKSRKKRTGAKDQKGNVNLADGTNSSHENTNTNHEINCGASHEELPENVRRTYAEVVKANSHCNREQKFLKSFKG